MSTIASILARIDALETAADAESETLQPNYLTINPTTGVIGASFTGLVNALGLTLPTAIVIPGATNKILWIVASNGLVSAQITSSEIAGIDLAEMDALATAAGNVAQAVHAANAFTSKRASLTAQASDAGTSSISIATEVSGKTLLDGLGQSSYPQLQGGAVRQQLIGQPARAFRNAALAIGVAASQSQLCDTSSYDDGTHLSNASGHLQYICPVAGYYLVTTETQIVTSALATMTGQIWKNGALNSQGSQITVPVAGQAWAVTAHDIVKCAANDTLEGAFQVSAVNTTSLQAGSTQRNYFAVQQLA